MQPVFSIIVPVYNVEKQLRYCLSSLENQTFQDFEIILIDDGSTDSSGVICDEYEKKNKKISCYHKQNGGLSDARNYGITKARGQFYLFIDSDDMIDERFCESVYALHKQYDAQIVSTDIFDFYNYSEIEDIRSNSVEGKVYVFKNKEIIKEYFCPKNERKITHGLCMKSYRADLFDDIRFDIGRLHEDLFITYKLLDKSEVLVYYNKPYYFYYQNNMGSISNNYKEKNFRDESDAVNNIINYYKNDILVFDELIFFVVYHYFYMVSKSSGIAELHKSYMQDVRIAKWLKCNIWKTNKLSMLKKVYYYICVCYPLGYLLKKRVKAYE